MNAIAIHVEDIVVSEITKSRIRIKDLRRNMDSQYLSGLRTGIRIPRFVVSYEGSGNTCYIRCEKQDLDYVYKTLSNLRSLMDSR